MTGTTARERLISYALSATPNEVTFAKTAQLADAYRDQVMAEFAQGDAREILARHRIHVLTEAADYLERIADVTEAQVADHYGPASGIGPGSADMVRLAAGSLRSLTTRTTKES